MSLVGSEGCLVRNKMAGSEMFMFGRDGCRGSWSLVPSRCWTLESCAWQPLVADRCRGKYPSKEELPSKIHPIKQVADQIVLPIKYYPNKYVAKEVPEQAWSVKYTRSSLIGKIHPNKT